MLDSLSMSELLRLSRLTCAGIPKLLKQALSMTRSNCQRPELQHEDLTPAPKAVESGSSVFGLPLAVACLVALAP